MLEFLKNHEACGFLACTSSGAKKIVHSTLKPSRFAHRRGTTIKDGFSNSSAFCAFFCLLPCFDISIRSGRKSRLSVATSTSKNRKAVNVGKFPIHSCFFRQIAIKWVVGKLKLLIPRALYSLKRKISSVTNILDYKICEV